MRIQVYAGFINFLPQSWEIIMKQLTFGLTLIFLFAMIKPNWSIEAQDNSNSITRNNVDFLQRTMTLQTGSVTDVDVQQNYLLAATTGSKVLYDLEHLEDGAITDSNGGTQTVALKPDLSKTSNLVWAISTYIIASSTDTYMYNEYPDWAWWRGHEAAATALAFDRAGNLFSASEDGQLLMWAYRDDPTTQAVPIIIYEHTAAINVLDVTEDGHFALGTADEQIILGTPDGITATLDFENAVVSIDWHPTNDNTLAFTLADGQAGFVVEQEITMLDIEDVTAVAWSPDGMQIALGQTTGTVAIWDTTTQAIEKTLVQHLTAVTELNWNDYFLISGGIDGLYLWNVATGESQTIDLNCCMSDPRTDYNDTAFIFKNDNRLWY